MILKELYSYCIGEFSFTDDCSFEALCLFEDILGYTKEQIYLSDAKVSQNDILKLNEVVARRKNGNNENYCIIN